MKQKDYTSVQQISIKTPDFMEIAVIVWFSIVEEQFSLRGITDTTTKFYTLIASLPLEIVTKISGSLLDSQNYDDFK